MPTPKPHSEKSAACRHSRLRGGGRTGSVNLAATELGVTSGAITQHVHTLEKYVGRRLVERSGRGIDLTVWGKLYLPRLTLDSRRSAKRWTTWIAAPTPITWSSVRPITRHQMAGATHVQLERAASRSHCHDRRVHPEPNLDEGEADFRVSYGERQRYHTRYTRLFSDHVLVAASPLCSRASAISQVHVNY